MPYFHKDDINLLFIHIPKTGGASLERYFSKKYDIPINLNMMWGFLPKEEKEQNDIRISSSLQHLTYKSLMKYSEFFKIKSENLKIMSIVRNPYNRIISDLFWCHVITKTSSKEEVYSAISKILSNYRGQYDNHFYPQYTYVSDENDKLIDNIIILRTETLDNDMHKMGYTDFDLHRNKTSPYNYNDYLNSDSIKIINNFYRKDFELFSYEKKTTPQEISAILYINLFFRGDRETSVLNEIKKLANICDNVHKIDAVYEEMCGHIGCAKSHIKAL
jgi:hypothetical protein